ncbi:MAG: hypothetical protein M1814_005658 [Vezdaea aestivalis]|nr:MAG: hypothetical protein M1814_005658 [Vezdaea aestivalis]
MSNSIGSAPLASKKLTLFSKLNIASRAMFKLRKAGRLISTLVRTSKKGDSAQAIVALTIVETAIDAVKTSVPQLNVPNQDAEASWSQESLQSALSEALSSSISGSDPNALHTATLEDVLTSDLSFRANNNLSMFEDSVRTSAASDAEEQSGFVAMLPLQPIPPLHRLLQSYPVVREPSSVTSEIVQSSAPEEINHSVSTQGQSSSPVRSRSVHEHDHTASTSTAITIPDPLTESEGVQGESFLEHYYISKHDHIEVLAQNTQELKSKLQQSQDKYSLVFEHLSAEQDDVLKLSGQLEDMKEENKSCNKKYTTLHADHLTLLTFAQKLIQENIDFCGSTNKSSQELTDYKNQFVESQNNLGLVLDRLREVEQSAQQGIYNERVKAAHIILALEKQRDAAQAERIELETACTQLDHQRVDLETACANMHLKNWQLTSRCESSEANAAAQVQQIISLKDELHERNKVVDEERRWSRDQAKIIEEKDKDLRAVTGTLQKVVLALGASRQESKIASDALISERAIHTDKVESMELTIKSLQETHTSPNCVAGPANSTSREIYLRRCLDDAVDKGSVAQQSITRMTTEIHELRSDQAQSHSKIVKVEGDLAEAKHSLETVVQAAKFDANMRARLHDAENTITEFEQKNWILEGDISRVRDELVEARMSLQEQVQINPEPASWARRTIDSLKEELVDLKNKVKLQNTQLHLVHANFNARAYSAHAQTKDADQLHDEIDEWRLRAEKAEREIQRSEEDLDRLRTDIRVADDLNNIAIGKANQERVETLAESLHMVQERNGMLKKLKGVESELKECRRFINALDCHAHGDAWPLAERMDFGGFKDLVALRKSHSDLIGELTLANQIITELEANPRQQSGEFFSTENMNNSENTSADAIPWGTGDLLNMEESITAEAEAEATPEVIADWEAQRDFRAEQKARVERDFERCIEPELRLDDEVVEQFKGQWILGEEPKSAMQWHLEEFGSDEGLF